MKKLVTSFPISLIFFFSPNGSCQEVDVSMIQSLSSDQIAAAKEVLNSDNLPNPIEGDLSNKEETLKNNEEDEKSLTAVTKFGYNFISTSPTSIIATGDLPLPNEYKISLGDVIGVVLSGSKERILICAFSLMEQFFFLN